MVRDGALFKRREIREGDRRPPLFEEIGFDPETKKTVGWVPCDIGPEDRWHMEAFASEPNLSDGTYELLGPKVQGNPEGWSHHQLVRHGSIAEMSWDDIPRTFEGLRDWLFGKDIEGVVFHHPDGRMAKIKLRDFGH